MTRPSALALVLVALLGAPACAPPCDRYCDVSAAYIERCLTEGTQEAWLAARAAGFGNWGVASADEYASTCQTDMDGQIASAADSSVLTQACEDEANEYELLEERAQCAELP